MPSTSRSYWTAQACGWGAYTLVNTAAFASFGTPKITSLAICVPYSAIGLALTHALRVRVGRRWRQLGITALAPRVVSTSVLLAAALNALSFAEVSVLFAHRDRMAFGQVAVAMFNASVVFLAWQLIYFGVHFLGRSKRAELEVVQAQAAAQGAELLYLRSQLQPHFLFNCLNSVRALISEDPVRAQLAVTQLANLLRHGLSTQQEMVPLEREMEVVNDYLALETLRFQDRLQVRVDIVGPAVAERVPAMLVQSLAENGVKHGIARLPEGGELTITARLLDGGLQLDVTNSSPQDSESDADGTRVGLANARERLRLLCGPEARLELDRSSPGRTVARLKIPSRS